MRETPPSLLEHLVNVNHDGVSGATLAVVLRPDADPDDTDAFGVGPLELAQTFAWDYQLWTSPDGQLWQVTIDNTGTFVTTAIQPRITEDGRQRATEDDRLRITEG